MTVAEIVRSGMVRDDAGRLWVRLDEVCHGLTCGKPSHRAPGPRKRFPPEVNCSMVRGWARLGWVHPMRVGRDTWYRLDELVEAEYRGATAPRGWRRGEPRRSKRPECSGSA